MKNKFIKFAYVLTIAVLMSICAVAVASADDSNTTDGNIQAYATPLYSLHPSDVPANTYTSTYSVQDNEGVRFFIMGRSNYPIKATSTEFSFSKLGNVSNGGTICVNMGKDYTVEILGSCSNGFVVWQPGTSTVVGDNSGVVTVPSAGYYYVTPNGAGTITAINVYAAGDVTTTTKATTTTTTESTTETTTLAISDADARVITPVGGSSPVFEVTAGDSNKYSAQAYNWLDESTGKSMTASDKFVAGQKYRLLVLFRAKTGYGFNSDTTFTFNSESTDLWQNTYANSAGRMKVYTAAESDADIIAKGDVDGDGKLAKYDAAYVLRYCSGLSSDKGNKDFDGDGYVTIKDALAIMDYISKNS